MVDANYNIIVVDIGSYGKEGVSGIFLKPFMGKQVLDWSFGFLEDFTLPGFCIVVSHVIVGNEAFRLHKHIIKPYNYRLRRARTFVLLF